MLEVVSLGAELEDCDRERDGKGSDIASVDVGSEQSSIKAHKVRIIYTSEGSIEKSNLTYNIAWHKWS